MFVPVAIVLMMHIRPSAQATQLSCNLDIHYRMYSSGKLVKCVDCRKCGPGLEPDIPCGTIIDKDTSIGPCRPCPKGTFSSKKNTKSCEKCKSGSCFAHQVVQGTCTRKSDTSRCIRECNAGYQMNGNQTECVMNKPDNRTIKEPAKSNTTTTPYPTPPTTPSNHPTTPMKSPPTIPSINSPTTPPSSSTPNTSSIKSPSTTPSINPPTAPSSLSTGVIITIIIAVLILIIAIIVVRVWYLRRTQDPRGFGAGLQRAKPDAGGEENVRFIKEEERKETGLPSCKMHCTETSGGFESSKPQQVATLFSNNNPNGQIHIPPKQHDALIIANETNMANSSGIPPASRNRQVVIDMPELSPITMFLGPQQQPQMLVNSSQQSTQTVVFTENHSVLSFNDMPLNIFEKICETFDVCGGTKSWRDVAIWLELGLNDVNHIELMDAKCRTRKVIETWANKTGNGVKKFESILRNKEMTSLADVIDAWMQSLKGK